MSLDDEDEDDYTSPAGSSQLDLADARDYLNRDRYVREMKARDRDRILRRVALSVLLVSPIILSMLEARKILSEALLTALRSTPNIISIGAAVAGLAVAVVAGYLKSGLDRTRTAFDRGRAAALEPADESKRPSPELTPADHVTPSGPRDFEVNGEFDEISDRLHEEIERLQFWSIINLSIGIVITAGAVLTLLLVVIKPDPGASNNIPWSFVIAFAPRLSLALLIEVFAYFFLKLYRQNQAEIKYYQNELTTVKLKKIALLGAHQYGDSHARSNVLVTLGGAERNYILRKGETTVELKEQEAEAASRNETLKGLVTLIKLTQGESGAAKSKSDGE
jgi:hypothetical protein